MLDKQALEKQYIEYVTLYNSELVKVEQVTKDTLNTLLNLSDSNKYIEERMHWYDDEDNPERNTWIDVEGMGYGWLWLNEQNNEDKWHGLIRECLIRYVESKKELISKRSEFVIVIMVNDKKIYHFIEREFSSRDVVFTFQNEELHY